MARQINVRLDDDDVAALEAAAFVGDRSLPEEARTALLRHVAEVKKDPLVIAMLALKATRTKENAAKVPAVSSLDARRDKSQKRA